MTIVTISTYPMFHDNDIKDPISNFSSVDQAFADDEASTRHLQILLFLLLSTASLMFIPCAVRSSFTFYDIVSIMLRFLGPMPGDHSSPGRVRKPVGPLGPPSPSG